MCICIEYRNSLEIVMKHGTCKKNVTHPDQKKKKMGCGISSREPRREFKCNTRFPNLPHSVVGNALGYIAYQRLSNTNRLCHDLS